MNKIEFKSKAKTQQREKVIRKVLIALGVISILTTLGIILSLFEETIAFFKEVSIVEFLLGTKWTPLLIPRHFGVLPLVMGTLLIVIISSIISIPIGLGSAIYVSEYAPK